MRIQVALAKDASTLTVHVERCNPAMPPAQVAVALAAAVESALQTLRPAPLVPAPVEPAPREPGPAKPGTPWEPAPAKPARAKPAAAPTPVERARVEPAQGEPAPAVGGASAVVPAPRAAGVGRDDGEVRARALRLLDDGLTDAQVCAQLGISRGRLLRWDDDLAHDAGLDLLADAGGAR